MFQEIYGAFETICLVGHTHFPGVFEETPEEDVANATWNFKFHDGNTPRFVPQKEIGDSFRYEGKKLIINVGSVGQPRDED